MVSTVTGFDTSEVPARCKQLEPRGRLDDAAMAGHRQGPTLQQGQQDRQKLHRSSVDVLDQQPVSTPDRLGQHSWTPNKATQDVGAMIGSQ